MGTQPSKSCGQQVSDSAPECICGEKDPHNASPPPSSPVPEQPEPEPEPSSSPQVIQQFRVSIANVPAVVHRWIAANPGQSALLIANGILILTPAALTGPLLATMGFGASGPVAGSVAAWLQSILGNVGARSVFAYLQSAAMGGYGVATVNGIVQAWGIISGAAVTAYNWPRRPNTRTSESTIPAPSSIVLNTSDQNYQAMLTTEPLDTANTVDVPADLSTPSTT